MKYIVYADGGARGNPGPAGAGAVIKGEGGEVLAEVSEYLGEQTNNYAEYMAVVLGLQALVTVVINNEKNTQLGHSVSKLELELKLDSELIVKQLQGKYKVKAEHLKPLNNQVKDLILKNFPQVTYTHIPREQNHEADTLANLAMDRG